MAMSLTIDGAQRGHAFISIIVIQAVFVEQEVVNTNEQYPFIIPLWRRLIGLFKWILRCISIFVVIVFCANAQFSSTSVSVFFVSGNRMNSLFYKPQWSWSVTTMLYVKYCASLIQRQAHLHYALQGGRKR